MIDRDDYLLLMTVLLDGCAEARDELDFVNKMQWAIITSYEINDPENGKVNIVDLTPFVQEAMGQHWHHFADLGIEAIEIVQYHIGGKLTLEAGRMLGKGRRDVAVDGITNMPEVALKGWAKGMTTGMRHHGVHVLKRLTGEEDETISSLGDNLGLGALIQQYLEEEVDETVAKFSAQLDSVFGVAAAVAPDWSAPRGEVKHDDLPPPG